ncbi:hypothetical protein [Moorena producens]|nr:hypothetical protein [Moorena producens]
MGRWGDGEMGRWGDGEIPNSSPCSLFPVPCSLLPAPCSLLPLLPLL